MREQLLNKNTVKKVLKQEFVIKQPPHFGPSVIRNGVSLPDNHWKSFCFLDMSNVSLDQVFLSHFPSTLQSWAGWNTSIIQLAYLHGRKKLSASACNERKVFILLKTDSNLFNHLQGKQLHKKHAEGGRYLSGFCRNSLTKEPNSSEEAWDVAACSLHLRTLIVDIELYR